MTIFQKKITNTFDIARELGVEENKIKELKDDKREISGETMDKVLVALNKSKAERNIEKLNIFEWYKKTDIKQLRKDFGYASSRQISTKVNIPPSEMCKFENKQYDKINKNIIKMYDFYNNDFNKRIDNEDELTEEEKIFSWYKNTSFKKLREGLKQKDISEKTGIPTSTLCFIEKHRATKYTNSIKKIYDYYHGIEPQIEHPSKAPILNDIDMLRRKVNKQEKEIEKLTRQINCYEKLIERL